MRKILSGLSLNLLTVILVPAVVYAHVAVTPAQATIGSETTFSMSVPNEKDVPVTELVLTVPSGLKDVQPTVHPGWTIAVTTNSAGDVTAITWGGGTIPAGQRDDFTFRGKAPAAATKLNWIARQTYQDSSVVNWNQKPTGTDTESESTGPYSVTDVVNDLSGNNTKPPVLTTPQSAWSTTLPLVLSLIALILSVLALAGRRTGNTGSTGETTSKLD
jgi:uncharacterized protein YcnI